MTEGARPRPGAETKKAPRTNPGGCRLAFLVGSDIRCQNPNDHEEHNEGSH